MKRNLVYCLFAAMCMAFSSVALSSCNMAFGGNKSGAKDKWSSRYRNMVNDKFLAMAKRYNADTRYFIFVDFSVPSNDYRLFLWDTESNGVVEKFWCAHGYGGGSTAERPQFSNTVGSNCSSLGWYLVDRSSGVSPKWGYSYHAVDGLSSSNSNARRRQVVLHYWSSVDRDFANRISRPMDVDGRSAGCFTTSTDGFKTLDRYIKSRNKRILLFAFDGLQ